MDARAALRGIWLPLVTPMRDGQVDVEAAARLAARYRDAGLDGLVLFGSTGEGGLLSPAEKRRVLAAIQEDPRALPVVVGAGGVDPREVAATVRRLDGLPLAGVLVPPPYYLRPAPAGILWHYGQVAAATAHPLIVYNVPARTGVSIDADTLDRLSEDGRVAAIKECNPAGLRRRRTRAGGPALLCGEDLACAEHLAEGGDGAIPVTAHIYPERYAAAWRLARAGRAEAARALLEPLAPLVRLLFAEPSPSPIKRALAMQGWIRDEVRPPLMPVSDALTRSLHDAMARLPACPAPARDAPREHVPHHGTSLMNAASPWPDAG